MSTPGIITKTERGEAPVWHRDPRIAASEYARQPGVPLAVRALCMFAAFDAGLGDGTCLSLSERWATDMEALLGDEYPDIDVAATLRTHLATVCRVEIHPERAHRVPIADTTEEESRRRKPPSTALSLRVFERDGYRCKQCGTNKHLTVDHINPISRGGSDDFDNLQTLCRSCNSRKGAR